MDKQQISSNATLTGWKIGFVVVVSFVLVSWLKQDGLSQYWQQTYQSSQAWDYLSENIPYWQTGKQLSSQIDSQIMFDNIANFNENVNRYANQTFYYQTLVRRQQEHQKKLAQQKAAQLAAQQAMIQAQNTANSQQKIAKDKIVFSSDEKVFFVGDSMMQGVAPWVMRTLQNDYHVKSIDLSKQSTGLSYSKFFDWPTNIEKTLQNNADIGVMVVFLGPNDPWDVPDPENRGKVVKFASECWQEIYTGHIQRILAATAKNNVQVLWVTPPAMKKARLNEGMIELRRIIHEAIRPEQAIVIDSEFTLSADGNYADSMQKDGKIVKVRTADGIHFTVEGQKMVANQVLSHLEVSQ